MKRLAGKYGVRRRGLTLVEMAIVLGVSLMVASATLMLMAQHLTVQRMLGTQGFMLEEVPALNDLMERFFKDADQFRIYATAEDARNDRNGVIAGGQAVVLFMNKPNRDASGTEGVWDQRLLLLAAVKDGDGERLEIWHFNNGVWDSSAAWVAGRGMKTLRFGIEDGVLVMDVTGKSSERIRYALTSQL